MKPHRDNTGINHRDKFCPVAVHRERDKPCKGYPVPMLPDASKPVEKSHRDKPRARLLKSPGSGYLTPWINAMGEPAALPWDERPEGPLAEVEQLEILEAVSDGPYR